VANDVAVTLKFAGKLDEAEHLYRRALAILERELGPDHPDLATLSTTSAGSPTRAATTPRPSRLRAGRSSCVGGCATVSVRVDENRHPRAEFRESVKREREHRATQHRATRKLQHGNGYRIRRVYRLSVLQGLVGAAVRA
jgi:hypothetical protein